MSGEPPQDADPADPADPATAATAAAVEKATPYSLHSAVYARRAEYVRPHRTRVKVGTWNVAACPGTDQDLASWFIDGKGIDRRLSVVAGGHGALERYTSSAEDEETAAATDSSSTQQQKQQHESVRVVGHDKVGLYVLGLQEIIDLKLASQYMSRVYAADPSMAVLAKWRVSVESHMPPGYELVASEHMSGLLLLVYASPEIAPMISHASTCAVGTGLLGMLGNKGAVSAELVLGEATRMVFVNSHLSSGSEASHSERRCWDYGQIESRTQFAPYVHPGVPYDSVPDHESIDDADFAFWFGDLNFRLDGLPGDDIRRILTLHTRGEYDLSRSRAASAAADGQRLAGADSPLAGEDAVVLKSPGSTASSGGDNRASWASSTTTAARTSMDTVNTASTTPTEGGVGDDDDDSGAPDAADNMKELPPLPPRPELAPDDGLAEPLPAPDDFVPDPSEDPASLQATLDSLLPHDQLRRMIKERRAFHEGWQEGRISFLPSYKYDVGTVGLFDSSEKQRAPSWCDRILYRTRKDKEAYDQRVRDEEEAKRRDEDMKARGIDRAGDDDDVLFEYQPDESEFLHRGGAGASAAGGFEYDEYDDAADGAPAAAGAYDPYDEGEDAAAAEDPRGSGKGIQQDLYTSHQRIQSSDHKPVVSLFTVDFDAAVPELKAVVLAEVAKELDRTENESRPDITIVVDSRVRDRQPSDSRSDDAAVDLGPLTFSQKAAASLTIANTGRVPAVFSFVEKPSTEDLGASGALVHHPYEWLKTSFERDDSAKTGVDMGRGRAGGAADLNNTLDLGAEVVLDPGDTVNALLEATVDDLVFARMLNEGTRSLDEVLVLRVVDGRDHFVPVRATWCATCIGRSVEELVRVPDGGIRLFMQQLTEQEQEGQPPGTRAGLGTHVDSSSHAIPYELEVKHSAPKELFKLTEAIEKLTDRAMADEQMLEDHKIPGADTAPGWPLESVLAAPSSPMYKHATVAVIDALDTDQPVLEAFAPEVPSLLRLEIVSHVLLLFLRGLTDGVVTMPLWSRIDQAPLTTLGTSYASAMAALLSPVPKAAVEADKNSVLDILSSAPHHNIFFVFLTATLSRMIGELSPLSLGDVDALRAISRSSTGTNTPVSADTAGGGGGGIGFASALSGISSLGRAFRRATITAATSTDPSSTAALAALERRMARERRYAEILGSVVCRASPSLTSKDKERRAQEDKQRAVAELFLRRSRDELI